MMKKATNKYLALGVLSPAATPKPKAGFNKRVLIFSSLFKR
jgi:hypothetical protein